MGYLTNDRYINTISISSSGISIIITILFGPTAVLEDNHPPLGGKRDHVVQRVETDRPHYDG